MNTEPKLVGYMRVSSNEQTHDLQRDALLSAGVDSKFICADIITGMKMKREGLERAMRLCFPGDTLVVWKIDRLGRSLTGVIDVIAQFDKRGVLFKSLTQSFDTTTPEGKAMMRMTMIFAELERDMIAERTKAGIAAYQARGGRMGQKHTVLDFPKRLERFSELWETGELFEMTGGDIRQAMIDADPKGKIPKGISWYFNWKSSGYKGFKRPDGTLEVDND